MTTSELQPLSTDPDCAPALEARAIDRSVADQVGAALKALSDPLRLRMLSFISAAPAGQACVCDLTALTDLSQPTVSHHLKVLREVGVLTSERRGTWVWYSITPGYRSAVTALLDSFAPTALAATTDAPHMTGLSDVDIALERLAEALSGRFAEVDDSLVRAIVRESYTGLARTATISAHLVPLTERFARQRLSDLTRDRAATPPQVLFVCVANAGRSQLAAALVHHYAGDRVTVRSAGSTPASEIHTGVRGALTALAAPPAFPKPLTDDAVRAADVVVTMGCGDVCPVIPGVSYEDWQVGDPALASPEGVAAIQAEIDRHVRELLADLVPDLQIPDGGPSASESTHREENNR
ncbi:metalloregulator ArsR/SmtB family transcription factor [Ruania halotolerans]|uniref:metalloregulator ArsR/SmtB family transcription factor n=1 Tax=Ruania halotolerans TaxID=2897773 RepID=UPI001E575826|nr:metalloregulator ArsR/SmtB family transcription factor [Ruania halotolerans]UFU06126.1 metalloregulator ArsR/SmtB family transcription factor [Ruania halotolerans]